MDRFKSRFLAATFLSTSSGLGVIFCKTYVYNYYYISYCCFSVSISLHDNEIQMSSILPGIVFQVQSVQCFGQQFSMFSMPHADQQHLFSSLHKQHVPGRNHKYQHIEPGI